jgi:hypothetical protein
LRDALLIHEHAEHWESLDEAQRGEVVRDYSALLQWLRDRRQLVDAGRLAPAGQAQTLRPGPADVVVTDGPFADSVEQFAGYLIVDVPDLEAATAVARRIPSLRFGAVEIRPMMELPSDPPA